MSGEGEVDRLRKQVAALARFGNHALRTGDLNGLLQEASVVVSETSGIELVKVLELLPDGETVFVRAGVNWRPDVVGHEIFGAHERSPAGYALQTDEPVVSADIATERRFEIPQLLIEHGVRSMVNVVIRGERDAWGVLEMDSRQPRAFNDDDIAFLQNFANLLAAAIDRLQAEAELKRAAERTSILLGELQHRVRNMLLNVRALARRTVKSSGSLEDFAPAFDARLLALGRTHDLLTRGAAISIRLEDILRQELKAHGADHGRRVLLSGPDIRLPPKAAQALGMAFHELATNASKHGALRHEGAELRVSWQMVADENENDVLIHWRETGVPIERPPERRGFGSETLEQSLPYMLGGEANVTFRADGVEWTIRFPQPSDREESVDEVEK
jgi:two-component sensor histidine kinase